MSVNGRDAAGQHVNQEWQEGHEVQQNNRRPWGRLLRGIIIKGVEFFFEDYITIDGFIVLVEFFGGR